MFLIKKRSSAQYLLTIRSCFPDSCFFSLRFGSVSLEFLRTVTSEAILKKKNCPVFVNINLEFLLAACPNSLVDSFQVYVMFMITNLIGSHIGKLVLNYLIDNYCPEFHNRLFDRYFFQSDFRKWLSRTLFWAFNFQIHPDSVILQKCQSLSDQSFQFNLVHMPSLNLIPNFFLNVYYTKNKRL